jgi:hypothetical protein
MGQVGRITRALLHPRRTLSNLRSQRAELLRLNAENAILRGQLKATGDELAEARAAVERLGRESSALRAQCTAVGIELAHARGGQPWIGGGSSSDLSRIDALAALAAILRPVGGPTVAP